MLNRFFCLIGAHSWCYRINDVGYVPLRGWPQGTACCHCGKPHPNPLTDEDEGLFACARAALAAAPAPVPVPGRRHLFPTPHQIAECGGPCEDGGPEACDCGLYERGTAPDPAPVVGEVANTEQINNLLQAIHAAYAAYGWIPDQDFTSLFDEVARCASIVEEGWDASVDPDVIKEKARAVLARCGGTTPAPDPVPVAERLPGAEDVAPWPDDPDSSPWCWTGREDGGGWEWQQRSAGVLTFCPGAFTHWLPDHAIPLPEVEP